MGSITKSIGYSYTNGDLLTLTTPSGQIVTYTYTNHRITSIKLNATTILSNVTYDPFGPANAWVWGNATTVSRAFDADGNPARILTGGITNTYTVDNASRITGISDSGLASNTYTFGYDLLDRVTSGVSTSTTRGYTYDANSNRLTTTGTTASTEHVDSLNNRLDSTSGAIARTYSYDTAGNTQGYGSNSYTFNQRGRLNVATVGGNATNYVYNALGQLIEKSGNGGTTLLMYDEAGHLLGEYSNTGALIQETIWMGDIPVATLLPSGSTVAIYYVHTDHLGTPRKITRPSDNGLMWRWDPDTFGSAAPNTNPSGLGTFTYNLRFPGQYSLNESGLYYNYLRTYDPNMGRYIESDSIGLAGGSYSTYAYAKDNPLSFTDPFGLFSLGFHVTEIPTFFVTGGNSGYTTSSVTHLKCTCSPTCGNNWQLKGCSGTLQVEVQIQILMFPLSKEFARRDEQQHVNDYGAARSAIESIVTQKENSLKRNQYPDEKTCADAAQAAITPILRDLQMRVAIASHNTYDLPGGPHGH